MDYKDSISCICVLIILLFGSIILLLNGYYQNQKQILDTKLFEINNNYSDNEEKIKEMQEELHKLRLDIEALKENHFIATAYTSNDEGCNTTTASGTTVKEGRTIAVDPSIIPLGSEVTIESNYPGVSGIYIAEDVGGAIKGNRIDIYMDDISRALSFGKREIIVRR